MLDSGLAEPAARASLDVLRGGAARGAFHWYRAVPFGSPADAGPVSVPALFVYGTRDSALGRAAADLTGRFVTGPYRYEVLDGVSHWIPEEAADRVGALLVDHMAAHPV